MKALTFASVLALSIAGSACSQAEETPTEPAPIETADTTSESVGSFNLGIPEDATATPASVGGSFNLDLPTTEASSTDGFNLGTDISASNGLSGVPEIESSLLEETIEDVEEDTTEELIDEEPIIRLE